MKLSYTEIIYQKGWRSDNINQKFASIINSLAKKTGKSTEEVATELFFIESQIIGKKYDGNIFDIPLKIRLYPKSTFHSSQESVIKKVFTF